MNAFLDRSARDLRKRFLALPPNLGGSLLMLLSFLTFTVMAILVREAAKTLPVVEIVFIRQMFGTLLLTPVFWRSRAAIRNARNVKLHFARGVTAVGAMSCGLSAVVFIPFADATAIQMAEVLFITLFAALILKEVVGWRRWTATAVGFVGVVIMLGPFSSGFDPYAIVALVGALFGAATVITLRLGASADGTETVLFYQGWIVLALAWPMAARVWVWPSAHALFVVFLMGFVYVAGQWLFTAAMRMGEASALAPLHYLRLILMSCVGFIVYGEIPSLRTAIGAVLVVGSASYTLRRNAVRKVPVTEVPQEGVIAKVETKD